MYKITLYDINCCPICDSTTYWFVEDLEEFEKNWLPLQCKYNLSTIEKYYRSKFGEVITEYWSDDPSLNIVQHVDATFLQEKTYTYKNKVVELENTYCWKTYIEFDELVFRLRFMKYDNKFLLVGQYSGTGCKIVMNDLWKLCPIDAKYGQVHFYGNKIAKHVKRYVNWEDRNNSDAYKSFYTDDKSFFKDEHIETFVWLPIKEVSEAYKIKALTKDEIMYFMRDIVGEAG